MRGTAFALVGLTLACAPSTLNAGGGDWQITRRVVLEEGAALAPDNASEPGEANPQSLSVIDGKVYVAVTNLFQFRPAGPSWVSVHDGVTLEREKSVRLQTDSAKCTNAGSTRAGSGKLYVSCAGLISDHPESPSDDGLLVELALPEATITRVALLGRSPGAMLVTGANIWAADLESPTLLRVDSASGAVRNGLNAEDPLPICQRGYASDLIQLGNRAFASCFNDDTVQEFDPATGARIGTPISVGDGPIRLSGRDGELAVLNSLGGTVSRLRLSGQAVEPMPEVKLGGDQGGNDSEGLAVAGGFAAATNAGVGTVVILDTQRSWQLVDAIDLKASSEAPTNSPYGVDASGDAFYIAIAGWGAPQSEIVRVARQ